MMMQTRIGLGAMAMLLAVAGCSKSGDPKSDDQPTPPTLAAEETTPIAAPDAPAYVGVWAAKPEWCGAAPGSADPGPVAFTEGEFIGYENLCRIGYAQEGTEGGWRLELICQSEGVEYTDLVDVDVDADDETLRIRREGGGETIYGRCAGA